MKNSNSQIQHPSRMSNQIELNFFQEMNRENKKENTPPFPALPRISNSLKSNSKNQKKDTSFIPSIDLLRIEAKKEIQEQMSYIDNTTYKIKDLDNKTIEVNFFNDYDLLKLISKDDLAYFEKLHKEYVHQLLALQAFKKQVDILFKKEPKNNRIREISYDLKNNRTQATTSIIDENLEAMENRSILIKYNPTYQKLLVKVSNNINDLHQYYIDKVSNHLYKISVFDVDYEIASYPCLVYNFRSIVKIAIEQIEYKSFRLDLMERMKALTKNYEIKILGKYLYFTSEYHMNTLKRDLIKKMYVKFHLQQDESTLVHCDFPFITSQSNTTLSDGEYIDSALVLLFESEKEAEEFIRLYQEPDQLESPIIIEDASPTNLEEKRNEDRFLICRMPTLN